MAVKDRLAELRNASAARGVYHDTVELGAPAPDDDIRQTFGEVERLHGWLREISNNTLLLRKIHADPTFHANRALQDELDSIVTQSNALGTKVCGALVQLEAKARVARNDARARIARLQYATARRRAADVLADHQALLQAVRETQQQLLHEQIKLTNLTISEEECEALLDSKNISLFVDNVKAETAAARLALRAVEARHAELARVEAALRDVRDLFLRLAHLVAQQQEQIDSVVHFALTATDYVESGERQLLRGVVSHGRARRKKIHLIICVVIGFAVVLMVLIIT
ncbi:syntaxin-1B-like [Plodia interpunctella]|uniref:syntaxin-1B-like n=1 Tax=Plodia interpunctella TaxID=58824 RepID=UPI0023680EB0|nr:syntaxin-1B-like [Plodia interpunctella]